MARRLSSQTLATGSILVALAVLAMKIIAWRVTGSVALYSDAMESFVNVAGAVLAWGAIWFAERPADKGHPFGHHKAENFSAIAEGSLIVVAAVLILQEVVTALRTVEQPEIGAIGLGVSGVALVLNFVWARVLIGAGHQRRSPALEANGRHLMTDVWTTAGVLMGLMLVALTGWHILDSVLAAVVALNILREGWKVVVSSAGDLMDSSVASEEREVIEAAVTGASQGALQIHDLRTRRAGRVVFIEFHLVVDGQMTVHRAHEICDAIEDNIQAQIPEARTTIHVEPDDMLEANGLEPE